MDGYDASCVVSRNDEVLGLEYKRERSDGKSKIWSLSLAVNCVEIPISAVNSSSGGGDFGSNVRGSGEERSSSIRDYLVFGGGGVRSNGDSLHAELIVSGRRKSLITDDWSAVGGINSSPSVYSSGDVFSESLVLEPNSEKRLVNEFLVNCLLEDRLDEVDGKRLESESENSVKRFISEEGSERSSLSEGDRRNDQLSCSNVSEGDSVLSLESGSRSGSVFNGPSSSILDVSGGLGRIELLLVVASGVLWLEVGDFVSLANFVDGLGVGVTARRITQKLAVEAITADIFTSSTRSVTSCIGNPEIG